MSAGNAWAWGSGCSFATAVSAASRSDFGLALGILAVSVGFAVLAWKCWKADQAEHALARTIRRVK